MRPTLAAALLTTALPLLAASPAGTVTTIAGTPGVDGYRDGAPTLALFAKPTWIDVDKKTGKIYVVDRLNGALRRIGSDGVTTLRVQQTPYEPEEFTGEFGGPFGGGIAIEPPTAGCGFGTNAYSIFVSTTGRDQITEIADTDAGAYLSHLDGSSSFIGRKELHQPTGLALSWGYVGFPFRDRICVADTGDHTIRYVSIGLGIEGCPQPGGASVLAGRSGEAGSNDGDASTARFNTPRGIASAPDGSVYVADAGNHTIRRVAPDGHVSTVAGVAGESGSDDGPATLAHLNTPSGIDVDSNGVVYIADTGNATIRRLTPDGMLTTLAGTPGVSGFADGDARTALFNGPVGVKVHGQGLLIADTSNHVIREWLPLPAHRRIVH